MCKNLPILNHKKLFEWWNWFVDSTAQQSRDKIGILTLDGNKCGGANEKREGKVEIKSKRDMVKNSIVVFFNFIGKYSHWYMILIQFEVFSEEEDILYSLNLRYIILILIFV